MTSVPIDVSEPPADPLREVVARHWGFTSLRPLQHEAMTAAVQGRDALVVLPTGGGKSLCYQAPALLTDKATVVVSPLISLMKDQVDSLIQRDIPAAYLNSSLDAEDRRRVWQGIGERRYRLVFIAPERFADEAFFRMLAGAGVSLFAIDEAHCISHWGHDFRADYRRLGQLKERCPGVPVHGFTATATPRVRQDIINQLGLDRPEVLVGDFFRANLRYRARRRVRGSEEIVAEVGSRTGQAGIVYCIRRADVEELAFLLQSAGVNAIGYHAGMSDETRTQAQEAFSTGRVDVVVATVAFGMGIDRADIRFVVHAAMPKSLEHYQQEAGRAGRDGEPADCVLFYSAADLQLWKSIIESTESEQAEEYLRLVGEMFRYCTSVSCRHRRLVTYFGQAWERDACGACDFCLDGPEPLADSTVLAQKIMSCVARTGQRFGAGHVADVLIGQMTDRVAQRGHDQLSTFALLSDQPRAAVMDWIDQLADQELLHREAEYRTLSITPAGWQVLRSQAEARLYAVARGPAAERRPGRRRRQHHSLAERVEPSHENAPHAATAPRPLSVDEQALFEQMRELRRSIAEERNVPAFVIFSDRTLRELARARPTTRPAMLAVKGVGPAKYADFGEQFQALIEKHIV